MAAVYRDELVMEVYEMKESNIDDRESPAFGVVPPPPPSPPPPLPDLNIEISGKDSLVPPATLSKEREPIAEHCMNLLDSIWSGMCSLNFIQAVNFRMCRSLKMCVY